MADDSRRAPESIAVGFQQLAEGLRADIRDLRDDVREDLVALEGRVTARVAAVEAEQASTRGLIEQFATDHAREHENEAEERRMTHGQFYDFIRAWELDRARRDGALGIVRWSIETLSAHAPRLVGLVLAIATALGLASGTISVHVGS